MKQIQRLATAVLLLSICVAAVASSGIVGKWKGHIEVDWSKVPKSQMTPDKLAKAKKQLADMVLIFDFKPNKTYTVTGSPGGSQSGHWSQKGTSVSVDDAKSKGAPKVMQLSKNGKVLAIAFAGMKLILNKE